MPEKYGKSIPFPETLKPCSRLDHRVHLPDLVETHPSKMAAAVASSTMSNYADARSRARSPNRARAAREKYRGAWYFTPVDPKAHARDHLDLHPRFETVTGQRCDRSSWCLFPTPVMDEPVVRPTKRELWEVAKFQKVPQRFGWDKREFKRDAERKHGMSKNLKLAGDWEMRPQGVSSGPKRKGNRRVGWTEDEVDGETATRNLDRDEEHEWNCEICRGRMGLDGDYEGGLLDPFDEKFRDEDALAWKQLEEQEREVSAADALLERARVKFEIRKRARTKKLEKEGWDYVERSAVTSPELESIDDNASATGYEWEDGFELL